ncbi:hypothetical protein E4T56_gene10710 [Termitomyces sp. T112]|nr:hypothetical protein E4T56_gene10710 [Termitomyces sp. T112]KAH0589340.1 hypothetical protein H2248_005099 [Termitomyces sp. 'cryptogamus']
MADLREKKRVEDDLNEDEQLKIKIPNPKMYLARQSLWIGRRGKPRCDHCRLNNLKCDRVLPACNHCSWTAGRECKYTPLPTPAHRGIPRCDRCRMNNLKCDRTLPVCNHCKDDGKTECNYTPKKRRKITSDNAQSPTESHSSPIRIENSPSRSLVDFDGPNFYGRNVASAPLPSTNGSAPSSYLESASISHSHMAQAGRFTAEPLLINQSVNAPLLTTVPERDYHGRHNSLSHSYDPSLTVHFVPWSNPSFAPLPDFMICQLENLNPVEFPDPTAFNTNLSELLEGMMPELREKSCLTSEIYTAVYRCLSRGDSSDLSPSMREWTLHHHLCPGSDVFYLILSPRENLFQTEDLKREAYRRTYCSHIDDEKLQERGKYLEMYPREMMDNADFFERVPVRDQIFDILTYAHITHESPPEMLRRIRKLGFASITWPMTELYTRLCPSCNFRDREAENHLIL